MQAQRQKPESQKQKKPASGKVENDRTEKGPPPESEVATLRQRMMELEKWGVLPPKLAEEMLSTSGKEAPAEYREIISRYYKRMNRFYERSR